MLCGSRRVHRLPAGGFWPVGWCARAVAAPCSGPRRQPAATPGPALSAPGSRRSAESREATPPSPPRPRRRGDGAAGRGRWPSPPAGRGRGPPGSEVAPAAGPPRPRPGRSSPCRPTGGSSGALSWYLGVWGGEGRSQLELVRGGAKRAWRSWTLQEATREQLQKVFSKVSLIT